MIIPGFSAYSITEDGVITKIASGKVVKPVLTYNRAHYAYMRVCLKDDLGRTRMHNVLRILALAFLERPDEYAEARAKDGNSLHTVLSNVEWVQRDALATELWRDGKIQRRARAGLCCTPESKELLLNTLPLYDEPMSMTDISVELQLPYSVVRYTIYALMQEGLVRKTDGKYEVIT